MNMGLRDATVPSVSAIKQDSVLAVPYDTSDTRFVVIPKWCLKYSQPSSLSSDPCDCLLLFLFVYNINPIVYFKIKHNDYSPFDR